MERLCTTNLSKLKPNVETPAYTQGSITAGIVHFGTGNFHRAHQAIYCDTLLNQGETRWGITGISLRSPAIRDKLAPQNFLYTQATLGKTNTYRIIGAIQNVLVAPENQQAVIEITASGQTQLVTTTITEKAYCLSNGQVDHKHPDFILDLDTLNMPHTIYGYLAAALAKRCVDNGGPLTILCCDNIQAGGEHLQKGVEILLKRHRPETLHWAAKNVSFASSMVDRVTPATNEQLKSDVSDRLGLYDAAPVAAEPFTQWVIENRFAGERPPFDRAGALFVDDIAPFEYIKLRFLNAGHSMLAALGYLAGDSFVHEALQRPTIAKFTEQALKLNVLPVTLVPEGVNGTTYIDQVLERFRNSNLPYAVLQVGTDSSLKIQQRWLPTIDDAISQGKDTSHLALALAAWVVFIHKALLNDDLNDPLRDEFFRIEFLETESDIQRCLALAGSDQFSYSSNAPFMAQVVAFYKAIVETGVENTLDTFLILNFNV